MSGRTGLSRLPVCCGVLLPSVRSRSLADITRCRGGVATVIRAPEKRLPDCFLIRRIPPPCRTGGPRSEAEARPFPQGSPAVPAAIPRLPGTGPAGPSVIQPLHWRHEGKPTDPSCAKKPLRARPGGCALPAPAACRWRNPRVSPGREGPASLPAGQLERQVRVRERVSLSRTLTPRRLNQAGALPTGCPRRGAIPGSAARRSARSASSCHRCAGRNPGWPR